MKWTCDFERYQRLPEKHTGTMEDAKITFWIIFPQ